MKAKRKVKKGNFFLNKHNLVIAWSLFLIYLLIIYIVCIKDTNNIFNGYILPLGISFVLLVILDIIINFLIKKYLIISNDRQIKKALKEIDDGPITVLRKEELLKDKYLSLEQYESLKNIRITNSLSSTIIALVMILLMIDFSGYLIKDIILPIIMIVGIVGICATIFDFILEGILRIFYHGRHEEKTKPVKKSHNNFIIKNRRIYYVPIMIILGIIFIMIFVDFSRVDKLYSRIVFPLEAITIIDMILILVIDTIISKVKAVHNIIYEPEPIDINENVSSLVDKELNDK